MKKICSSMSCPYSMRIVLLAIFVSCVAYFCQAEISNLTVNMMPTPSFVDESPTLGWQLAGDKAGISQTAYEIKIYTDDKLANQVYSSGLVESSQSQNIALTDFHMSPATRYYWTVDVRDNSGKMTTSRPMYFDTGLMGDWSGAKWLRLGDRLLNDKNYKYDSVDQIIELTINTVSGNPGITFDTDDESNCFCWQFMLDGDCVTLKRIMYSWGGNMTVLGEAKLKDFKKSDFLGKDVRIKLETSGPQNSVTTYVNGTKVDEFKIRDRLIYPERIGFCDKSSAAEHEIYFSDITHYYSYADGVRELYMSEDFKDGVSHHFLDLDIVEMYGVYKGHVKGGPEGYFVSEMISHRPVYYIDFNIGKPVRSVKLYTSTIGNFDAYVNGKRVGTILPDGTTVYEELKPSFTDFRYTVCYFAHDVTSLCSNGYNILGIELNEGYSGGAISHGVHKNLRSVIAK